jgi:hypothetical protein
MSPCPSARSLMPTIVRRCITYWIVPWMRVDILLSRERTIRRPRGAVHRLHDECPGARRPAGPERLGGVAGGAEHECSPRGRNRRPVVRWVVTHAHDLVADPKRLLVARQDPVGAVDVAAHGVLKPRELYRPPRPWPSCNTHGQTSAARRSIVTAFVHTNPDRRSARHPAKRPIVRARWSPSG